MLLILGGARSGKSSFAEERARTLSDTKGSHVLYIATAIAFDEDMKDRIKKHQESRPSHWHTVERFKGFSALATHEDFKVSDIILVDCVTLMVSNLLLQYEVDFDHIDRTAIDEMEIAITKEVEDLVEVCAHHNKTLIMVSNEVGLGVVPAYRLGNIFRDIAGRVNQRLAKKAEEVFFLASGLPLKLK